MKRLFIVCAIVLAVGAVSPAFAWNYGDSWILPIADRQGGGWNEIAGAGYGGSSAWQASGQDGVRRVYWKLDQAGMPTTTELWLIEAWAPTSGAGNWQPIESQFKGSAGETWPIEPGIPWAGMFGTNHQYVGSDFSEGQRGTWVGTGPGPQMPSGVYYDPAYDGKLMYLQGGTSWLYAKWDFGWSIDRSWSALRVTVLPEPGSVVALGGGLLSMLGMALRRRS